MIASRAGTERIPTIERELERAELPLFAGRQGGNFVRSGAVGHASRR